MDVPGIVTKTVEDVVTVLSVLIGPDTNDSTSVNTNLDTNSFKSNFLIEKCRIGIPEEYNCEGLSDDIKETWDYVANLINDSKATVKKV